jgi:hypothetical protein
MMDHAEGKGMEEYSVIGHSQGGLVATHMLNFYWGGLDNITQGIGYCFCFFLIYSLAGRLIQTVASPFQGNTAAGGTANLGEIFGVGCGANTDLR